MSKIIYPPYCQPLNRVLHEKMLETRLEKILEYFIRFSHQHDYIYQYQKLWTQLNEIAETHSCESVALLAVCAAAEICKQFATVPPEQHKYILPSDFQKLYKLVAQFLKDINNEANFTWKYNLLRTFAEEELFHLNLFSAGIYKDVSEEMFIIMFDALKQFENSCDLRESVYELILLGIRQLVESAGVCVDAHIVLQKVLTPLITGTATTRHLVQKCISCLKICHFQILCAIVTHRVVLKEKNELFNGKELIIAEKAIMLVPDVQVFDSVYFIISREALNHFHPDHEQITRILCTLIVRCTETARNKWKILELENKKNIQTMVSRFIKAMTNPNFRPYTSILLKYGEQLLNYSPSVEIKFRYFQVFKHYIKITSGEPRSFLINIFDKNLCKNK